MYFEDGNFINWSLGDPLKAILTNPVAYRCVDLIGDMVAKAKVFVDGEEADNHPLNLLLENPNKVQSRQDFIKEILFFKFAYGWCYSVPTKIAGMDEYVAVNLNPCHVKFPNKTPNRLKVLFDTKEIRFDYQNGNEKRSFEWDEIVPIFDTPSGVSSEFMLTAGSRLNAIEKYIRNINMAMDANYSGLEKAGRFVSFGDVKNQYGAQKLSETDKQAAEKSINSYGLGRSKNINLSSVPLGRIDYHVNLSQLKIPETVQGSTISIMNHFGVPKELYPVIASGATYENFKEAQVALAQNAALDAATDIYNQYSKYFKAELAEPNFDHLPSMSIIEDRKADKLVKMAVAIEKLTRAGVDPQQYIDAVGITL